MQYIFDTNFYRNIVTEETNEGLNTFSTNLSSKALFPTIVSIELINHLAIDDNARNDCLKALKFLFLQSSEIRDGRIRGTVVPTFYDLLTLYFFSKESKHYSLANKTFLMAHDVYYGRYQIDTFLDDVEIIKSFKKNELENIISNLEKYYLSSFNKNNEINWDVFQINIQLKNEFLELLKSGSLNELFGLSLLKLAIEEVEEIDIEVSTDFFKNKFLKDFEISIDFFVNHILKKLLEVEKTEYLKYPNTDAKKRWNSFYDFQLIFATEFENCQGRETIFVTRENKIREHFYKFGKGHLTLSIDEFKHK